MSDRKTVRRSRISAAHLLNKYGIVFILLGICILMSILSPAFFSVRNLTNVVRQVSIIGIIATLIFGFVLFLATALFNSVV